MPPPDARSSRPLNRATAKRTIPQCACQWSENTEKLQETCTRPICMHAKTPVTSVACGIRGRRFYLALFRYCRSPRICTPPFYRHSKLGLNIVLKAKLARFVTRMSRQGCQTRSKDYAIGVRCRRYGIAAALRLFCSRIAIGLPCCEPFARLAGDDCQSQRPPTERHLLSGRPSFRSFFGDRAEMLVHQ